MSAPLSSILIALLLVLPCCFCDNHHNLESKYNFRKVLHPHYTLYWNYNPTDSNLTFAVRVETTGWVGFGISPNGGMVGSDMVIGWVQDGRSYFNDRFATAQSTPAVDMQEDWFLIRFCVSFQCCLSHWR
ncbi:PREDICTED: DBH-like monooxygenase protein 2 homolog [Amphimedon queenslandica]|uniref:DOMON domain-containing protein n=1 Tax=Amphimedon queenslandica TaxID=400682 RepID=A0AAN0JA82_AMPQE|nr:PREDICTED: DBH-like monooxygenase protein 2 homolog [Amphimedon queenslandica]|eukprot:XP_019853641.1 PREDICTED: DBH-like monooxygenase protein 2 homolog [Amphimedon queenslandica]